MGYRITYEAGQIQKKPVRNRKRRTKAPAVALVCALVLFAMALKHTWLPFVRDFLIPGDDAVTAAAWAQLTQDLKNGEPLEEALEAFCREIMEQATDPT